MDYNADSSEPDDNPLNKSVSILFSKLGQLNDSIHQIVVQHDKLKPEIERKTYHLMGRLPVLFHDLTDKKKSSNEPVPRILKPISRDEFIDFIDDTTCREVGYGISEAYEYFETFLYNILTDYMKKKYTSYQGLLDWKEIREKLKNDLRSSNNSKAFAKIRTESKSYEEFEAHNVQKINLIDWYAVFSTVRHAVTHSGQTLDLNSFLKLSKRQQSMFDELIPKNVSEQSILMRPTYSSLRQAIINAGSHGFLIFRCLSNELKLNSLPLFEDQFFWEMQRKLKEAEAAKLGKDNCLEKVLSALKKIKSRIP